MEIVKSSKFLLSFASIVFAAALVIGATVAFFSDTETSSNNLLEAGAVDLKIDNTSYINGVLNPGTTWDLNDLTDQLFFNFNDIKPGDVGEDTISLHAQNDCWLCAEISLTANDDNTCTEPELLNDPTCNDPDSDPIDGELAQNINFIFWADDGDNVLEQDEYPAKLIDEGTAQDILDGNVITLADSTTNNLGGVDGQPMPGGFGPDGPDEGTDPDPLISYIGKVWCFGAITPAPVAQGANDPTINSGITCDGTQLDNATQTDKLLADIKFTAIQARNNPNFVCTPEATPSPTPSVTPSPSPSPEPCAQADVMLVLDRSGSISAGELNSLKTAATDFVDALGLSTTGIHAGQSSFSTSGTLDQTLTDSEAAMDAAIAALSSGGLTNLKSGIDLATGELTGGNDRADLTSPDKMIIITDGHPNRPLPSSTADDVAAAAADAARAAGIEVFVVGVGGDVNTSYLQNEIADDAAHYFSVSDYSALQTTLQNLDLCTQQP